MHIGIHQHQRPAVTPAAEAAAGTRRPVGRVLLALGAALWLASGVYTVQPNEQAVVRRCGRMLGDLRGPGLHVGCPAGLDRVTRVRLQELRRVAVGASLAGRAAGRGEVEAWEGFTGDRNLLGVSAVVQFRIADARAFLFAAADVSVLVGDAAAAALASTIASMTVDDVLTTERVAIQERVKESAQTKLSAYGAGVQVVAVTLESAAPPAEVAAAFRDVAAAREDRQRAINEAEGYANRLIPQARGEAEQMRLAAQGSADAAVQTARGEADRFRAQADQLAVARDLTIRRLVLEAAEEILPKLNKVVIDPAARQRLDLGVFEDRP
jgi:modulator of FtsH protease HflK